MFEVPHPLLVCIYTNVAVDNLVDGLARAGVKPLRVGYSGNVREGLLEHTLDAKLCAHALHPTLTQLVDDSARNVKEIDDLWRRSRALEAKISGTHAPKKNVVTRARNMRKALVALQMKQMKLKTAIYGMQQQMLQDVVADADVVSFSLFIELTFFTALFIVGIEKATNSFFICLDLHNVYHDGL